MPGRSEFKIRIDQSAVREITEMTKNTAWAVEKYVLTGAPYGDVATVAVLFALVTYLEERNCEPDFELVFHE